MNFLAEIGLTLVESAIVEVTIKPKRIAVDFLQQSIRSSVRLETSYIALISQRWTPVPCFVTLTDVLRGSALLCLPIYSRKSI